MSRERPYSWWVRDHLGTDLTSGLDAHQSLQEAAQALQGAVRLIYRPQRCLVRQETSWDAQGARELLYHFYGLSGPPGQPLLTWRECRRLDRANVAVGRATLGIVGWTVFAAVVLWLATS